MRLVPLLACALVFAGCGRDPTPPVVIGSIEITAPRPGMGMSAGYLTIMNHGDSTVAITRVASPQFGSVELHESKIVDGVARMRPIERLEIDGGATVTLERGGKHLMLMQPVDDLDIVTLNFYADDKLLVTVRTGIEPRH